MFQCILFVIVAVIVWQSASAATNDCDLSSDEPSECLASKFRAAEQILATRTVALQAAISDRVRRDPSGTARFADTIKDSDAAWRRNREANCSIIEAAFYDGGGRLNAIEQCQLEETELRNARLSKLLLQFGTPRKQGAKTNGKN
jgi:uncharacterized protein YecT (DUF1311 family)